MAKASEIKKGLVVELDGKLLMVRDIDMQTPSARGGATLYKMRFTDLKTGHKVEERFKGDEQLSTVELQRRTVVLSYLDGEEHIFMDDEDLTQYPIRSSDIADELLFLDESIAGLNPPGQQEMVALIRTLAQSGLAIVMVEHIMHVIMSLSDHVICMAFGELLAEGDPHAVAAHPDVIRAYLGDDSD